jgi:hypothetical protein
LQEEGDDADAVPKRVDERGAEIADEQQFPFLLRPDHRETDEVTEDAGIGHVADNPAHHARQEQQQRAGHGRAKVVARLVDPGDGARHILQ